MFTILLEEQRGAEWVEIVRSTVVGNTERDEAEQELLDLAEDRVAPCRMRVEDEQGKTISTKDVL